MNLPNKITLARIVLAFVFMFFLFSKGVLFKSLALGTFMLAAFSDYLDGYLARKHGDVSIFGKIMDPVADKVLTLSAFLAFVEMKLVPAWMVVIIVFREILITGLRLMALKNDVVLHAGRGGKHKTVLQILAIMIILVFILFKEMGVVSLGFWNTDFEYWYRQLIFVLMGVTVILTVVSGASYMIDNRKYFLNEKST